MSYQDGRHSCHNGGGSEPVADHGEVGEVSLDGGVHDGGGPGVTEGRPVLVEEIYQLLADEPEIDLQSTAVSIDQVGVTWWPPGDLSTCRRHCAAY